MLVQSIYKAKPIDDKKVYDYFLTFKGLDYSVRKNRERLIDLFVRKVVVYNDGRKKITFNCLDGGDGDIKENSAKMAEFDYIACGTPKGNRTPVSAVRGRRLDRLTMRAYNF